MSHVLHRDLSRPLPMIVGGEGHYLIDDTGKRYFDACGGAAVACLGHDAGPVAEAVARQMARMSFAHTGFFTNDAAEALSECLVTGAPEGTGAGRVMYLGSGSEAMEAAIKLARQYHLERGAPDRVKLIARAPSYHGNTLAALAVGGHAGRRAPFQPLLMDVAHIDAPYAYRLQHDGESEADFADRMAAQLEAKITELGADTVAAFIAEPVVGASLGTQPAPAGYYARIREICDRHGVLFIADEVMSGMGRTGTLFAMAQEGVAADITTLAKGLGAGFVPIAAVLASEKVMAPIVAGSARLWNGHTYMSHAVACAGALAVQQEIARRDLLSNVRAMGDRLGTALRDRFAGHPHLGDIRGRGLFWSVEFVADPATKAPFEAARGIAPAIQSAALADGLMCYPGQGCADGARGDHILLAPAYTVTAEEVDLVVDMLGRVVEKVLP